MPLQDNTPAVLKECITAFRSNLCCEVNAIFTILNRKICQDCFCDLLKLYGLSDFISEKTSRAIAEHNMMYSQQQQQGQYQSQLGSYSQSNSSFGGLGGVLGTFGQL